MSEVIIIGAGGHAAEIDEYIKYSKRVGIISFNVIGFLDDDPTMYSRYRFSAPFLGSVKEHRVIKGISYLIGIANTKHRKILVDKFEAENAEFVTLIHGSAYVSESALIGKGAIIGPNANIGPNVRVGNFSLVNSRCSLGHDTEIGEYNFISPNVCFSGFSLIGDENLFGINSATLPSIHVGNRNKIAAGMILDQDVGDDTVVFHRFKERVIAIPKIKS